MTAFANKNMGLYYLLDILASLFTKIAETRNIYVGLQAYLEQEIKKELGSTPEVS
jgi:hypothetical protein